MILVNVLCVLCFKYWKSAFVFIILSTVLYSVFSFSDVVVLISNWFELKILAILEWFGAVRMVNEFSFSLHRPTSNPKSNQVLLWPQKIHLNITKTHEKNRFLNDVYIFTSYIINYEATSLDIPCSHVWKK